MMICFGVQIW